VVVVSLFDESVVCSCRCLMSLYLWCRCLSLWWCRCLRVCGGVVV
jgi:hypothetical protein